MTNAQYIYKIGIQIFRSKKIPGGYFNEEIEVKILEVSSEERKLSLGVKQLTVNPWDAAESKFTILISLTLFIT